MPDLQPGDLLRVFVELEVSTDAQTSKHPGLIGTPYSYAPHIDARLLLAADNKAGKPERGRAIALSGAAWIGKCSHERHHEVIVMTGEYLIPTAGVRWPDPHLNVAVRAWHPNAKARNVLLIGENEKKPVVVQDLSGVRVLRLRPASQPAVTAEPREVRLRVSSVPVNKTEVVVLSKEVRDLKADEQLFVSSRLATDASGLGYPVRIATDLFLADSPTTLEPADEAQTISTWKGHLSKRNALNRLPGEGQRHADKFGVMRIVKSATKPLYVNLVVDCGAPFKPGGITRGRLPVRSGSFIEMIHYPADRNG